MKRFGTLKLVVTCVVLMVAVPFGLRHLLDRYAPRDDEATRSASEKMQELFGDGLTPSERSRELLVKPVGDWTERDVATEPALHRWLKAHEKTVLPWDWSEAAKAKDAVRYSKCWKSMIRELSETCDGTVSAAKRQMRTMDPEIAEQKGLVTRVAARLDAMKSALASNGVPVTVEIETVERGRFWGFNRKIEKRTLESADALRETIGAETKRLAKLRETIAGLETERSAADRRMREHAATSAELLKLKVDDDAARDVLIRAIRLCDTVRNVGCG